MAKQRARIIDDSVIKVIEHILDKWEGKLTWDSLIAAVKVSVATEYTRQALAGHERIAAAFSNRKLSVRERKDLPSSGDPRVDALMKTIETLEAENARLELECSRHRAMFIRWTANSWKKNITEAELNAELAPVHRGESKEENVVPLVRSKKKKGSK